MKFIYVSETSYTHSLKATSYAIFSMCFDYNLSYEVKCGFFSLITLCWRSKIFWSESILGFGIRDDQPTTGISHSLFPEAADLCRCSGFGGTQLCQAPETLAVRNEGSKLNCRQAGPLSCRGSGQSTEGSKTQGGGLRVQRFLSSCPVGPQMAQIWLEPCPL